MPTPPARPTTAEAGPPAPSPAPAPSPSPSMGFGAPQTGARGASAPDAAQPAAESRLIVGPNIKLKGVEITDCDTLVVEGRVEASMDSRVIQIAKNGVFKGSVAIDRAEVHGVFDGELTAREQLVVHATGRVSGKIRYGKIAIEEGGVISGDIDAMRNGGARRDEPRSEGNVEPLKPEREQGVAGG